MGARRFASLSVAWLCLATGCVLLCGASAQATEVHVFQGSFGSEGNGPGQFKAPFGVAVNDATHNVYVVDSANNRVQEFNSTGSTVLGEFDGSVAPTGAFSEPTQIAVDNSGDPLDPSAGDVYVVDRGHGVIDKFSAGGTYEGQLAGVGAPGGAFEAGQVSPRSIEGVAVDPNGTVWVSTYKGPIYSFTDALANQYSSERSTVFGGVAEGLAVDAEDNLYFYVGGGDVVKVDSSGGTLSNPFGGDRKAFAVAVDPLGHEVYLDNLETTIEAFDLNGVPVESDESGTYLPSFGSGYLKASPGIAVDPGDGTVYATDRETDRVLAFKAVSVPNVSIGAVSEQTPRSLTLNGTVTPEGKPVTSCVFEYGTTDAYGQSVPCAPQASALGSGQSPVAVSTHLTGLTPGVTYHYRLVAENLAHIAISTPDRELVAGPMVGGESVVDVASGSATPQASIDPNGADTHYYVQYGPTVAYGSYAPVSPPGSDLGSTVGQQLVSVHLQGLEAGAGYHYRFVVVQDGEVFEEPDGSFTTQPPGMASSLADGRVWELVSPANKKGALIELFEQGGQVQAADDGSGITYMSQGPAVGEDPAGKITYAQVLSRRGPEGWKSEDLTLPGRLPENGETSVSIQTYYQEYHLFSPDLSLAGVEPQGGGTPLLSPEATEQTLYLRDDVNGSFLPLVTAANVPPGVRIDELNYIGATSGEWEMHFLAATPDLAHVVFKTPMALTAEAIDEESIQDPLPEGETQWNLYEWSGGQLQLVNVLPGSEGVAHDKGSAVPPVRLAGMATAGGYPRGNVQRDVSNDGRRIAWTWGQPYTPQELEHFKGLYVRDMVEEKTVRVGGASAIYQTMNSDGSKIFFRENGDLYEFDFETGTQTDLTGAHGPGENNGGVQEIVSDVSENGSYIYFVATGVLGHGGVSGKDNLYLLHDTGDGWSTTYIATLSIEDEPSWYGQGAFEAVPALVGVSSRVSPDGRYLAFMSNRSLTGYDNTDAVSGQLDEEVYLYDAQEEKLVCASCDPTGARPVGVFDTIGSELLVDREHFWTSDNPTHKTGDIDHWLAGSVPGWDNPGNDPATYQPRYLSDSGRLFFDSPDALVAQDTNGLEDPYEYEPAGVGGCVVNGVGFSERSDGCVGLVSSGTSSSESAFYDASENGDDVFFSTTGKLVGEDYDKGYDVYDAHVCTSTVPCKTVPVAPPSCTSGDSCKAAPSPQPEIFGPAPSATFNGIGNVTASPAVSAVRAKSLTNARKLAQALRICRTERGKRRGACEARARRRYPIKRAGKATKTIQKGNR
jgi:DNA-binding beta-propeller fold protein YncE